MALTAGDMPNISANTAAAATIFFCFLFMFRLTSVKARELRISPQKKIPVCNRRDMQNSRTCIF
jgi:hypothetical protein